MKSLLFWENISISSIQEIWTECLCVCQTLGHTQISVINKTDKTPKLTGISFKVYEWTFWRHLLTILEIFVYTMNLCYNISKNVCVFEILCYN